MMRVRNFLHMQGVKLATPGATDLLAAFAKISDGEARRAVLTIAQALTGEAAARTHAAA